MHPFTGIHVTEAGLDYLEQYVADVRAVIGYEVPLATDHFGHIGLQDCIKIARRLDKFNLAWYEDMLPWQMTDQYVRLAQSCTTPICTGEDIYLKENFKPLFESGGVSVIHPDLLIVRRHLREQEDRRPGAGVRRVDGRPHGRIAHRVHGCRPQRRRAPRTSWRWRTTPSTRPGGTTSPTACPSRSSRDGFIDVPDTPGLGIESLNDEVIAAHLDPNEPGLWEPTDVWDREFTNDRLWS